MNNKLLISVITGMTLSFANSAHATSLDDLIVTAKSNSTSKEIAASVSIITAEEIAQSGANTLQDVLRQVPGFSYTVNSSSTNGRQNIGLRGMDSEHVLILIDGERISATDGFIGHSNFQSSWVDVGSIERVEVMKGMGAVLYGSEAMGGVVNIITNASSKGNYARYSLSTSSLANRKGGESNRLSLNTGVKVTDQLHLSANLSLAKKEAVGENGVTKFEADKNQNARVQLAYNFTPSTELILGLSQGLENRDFIDEPYYEIDRTQKSIELKSKLAGWDSRFKAYQVESDIGYHGFGMSPYYSHYIDDTVLRAEFMGTLFENRHFVTWGVERHTMDYTKDYANPATADYKAKGTTQNALFIQDKFKLGTGTLTAGVRVDDNDQYGSGTSPEVGYVFPINDNLDLKMQYSEAFKAPNIKEADDNYIYSHGFPGASATQGNSDLKAETSQSFEVGLSGLLGTTSWSASLFRIQADNLVEMQDTGTTYSGTGGKLFKYQNVDKATIDGAEFVVSTDLTSKLFLDASYNRMETDDGKGGQLAFRPDQTIKARLTYEMPKNLSASWAVNHTGDAKDGLNKVAAYTLNDFALNKRFNKAISVQFAVNNVFDVLNDDTQDNHITELPGREYKLTLSGAF